MADDLYAVILAGGGGTRLWPLSRSGHPKQTLTLFGDRSLFQLAVDRLRPLIALDHVRVATVEEQVPLLTADAPDLVPDNFIVEPFGRGTAPIIGLCALELQRSNPQAVMAVVTADHYIGDEDLFRRLLAAAADAADQGHLVTLGVQPVEPATGYGYLHQGHELGRAGGFPMYRVESFREKPDAKTAQSYLASGEYVWNSGMFVWRVDRILDEIDRHMPGLSGALAELSEAGGRPSRSTALSSIWSGLSSETIDYGVMEAAEDVVVLPAQGLGWWDVGSWGRLFDVLDPDDDGNLRLAAKPIMVDTRGTLVVQEEGLDRLIATLGVDDLVIVDTGVALLVTSRHRAEAVRQIVDKLKKDGREGYL
jgi:mannose-1-phosphate guanylyltransferase